MPESARQGVFSLLAFNFVGRHFDTSAPTNIIYMAQSENSLVVFFNTAGPLKMILALNPGKRHPQPEKRHLNHWFIKRNLNHWFSLKNDTWIIDSAWKSDPWFRVSLFRLRVSLFSILWNPVFQTPHQTQKRHLNHFLKGPWFRRGVSGLGHIYIWTREVIRYTYINRFAYYIYT